MSKKGDRKNTNYRYCPICGGKAISIKIKRKLFRRSNFYINCWKCRKQIMVKEDN